MSFEDVEAGDGRGGNLGWCDMWPRMAGGSRAPGPADLAVGTCMAHAPAKLLYGGTWMASRDGHDCHVSRRRGHPVSGKARTAGVAARAPLRHQGCSRTRSSALSHRRASQQVWPV
eukprot:365126-Chlamydomonas_euryale.AAC.46